MEIFSDSFDSDVVFLSFSVFYVVFLSFSVFYGFHVTHNLELVQLLPTSNPSHFTKYTIKCFIKDALLNIIMVCLDCDEK